ncbi:MULTISPECIES: hypothetical protein [Roseobacteraceae]|uniref:Uncharacterized protein n=1 Tax=Celeribacter baekdonensis B30 TaxID=1208323 RepID=K2J6U9_9RHOB|nr:MULTISPECIES: hypothetical protein [Roseobacteraceae]EKE70768.1 hypothetical protein B30_12232 [Celeribacter baekdonensis B30]KAB6715974.1 hypothetical protein C8029_12235 [Roseobacter sp. TSBP12]
MSDTFNYVGVKFGMAGEYPQFLAAELEKVRAQGQKMCLAVVAVLSGAATVVSWLISLEKPARAGIISMVSEASIGTLPLLLWVLLSLVAGFCCLFYLVFALLLAFSANPIFAPIEKRGCFPPRWLRKLDEAKFSESSPDTWKTNLENILQKRLALRDAADFIAYMLLGTCGALAIFVILQAWKWV